MRTSIYHGQTLAHGEGGGGGSGTETRTGMELIIRACYAVEAPSQVCYSRSTIELSSRNPVPVR